MPPEVEAIEVVTYRGTFIVWQSVTLGELLIALSVLLLVSFLVLKWLLDTVWRRGGR